MDRYWYTVICEAVFVLLSHVAIRLPSPSNFTHQAAYDFLVGGYIHGLLANAFALLISFYLNVLLLNKYRVLLKGKYYYLRSLGATAVGEISYTIITNVIAYFGVLTWAEIQNVIISDYIAKLIYSAIIAYPAALLVAYVKVKYSSDIDGYSPFSYRDNTKVVDLTGYKEKNLYATWRTNR